jgi:hypothetical protein
MRTMKRLLIVSVALALPLWAAGTAAGGDLETFCDKNPNHAKCQDEPPEDPPPGPLLPSSCADSGWESPLDGSLLISSTVSESCQDVAGVVPGAEFLFEFAAGGDTIRTFFVLGVRNSVPGDWCRGTWVLRDAAGVEVAGGYGNALRSGEIGDGWSATWTVGDEFDGDGNCTTDGSLIVPPDDDPRSVLSLADAGGKPLKQVITVTWSSNP